MEIDALLCDHAQVAGKLFISGANIDSFAFAPNDPGPYWLNFAVAGVVHVAWTATNTEHRLQFLIVDGDGNTPRLGGGAQVAPTGIGGEFHFNVGRPPGLPSGDEQLVPFAFAFMALPLADAGSYNVRLLIDGTDVKSIHFRVTQPPQLAQSYGATAPGPLGG